MARLELRDVSKTYPGGAEAVKQASIDIADGEFVVLVGPSGCGKSTILRMVAGLESVTAGEVRIDGVPVNTVEPGDRDIAMVFQTYALYPHMSVYDNMAYGLRNGRMPRAEIDERIRAVADMLQLADYLKRKPRQLSGGQRQRVAMGRAIVREPKAFLLDEPLSNLDTKLRAHMRAELKQLHKRLASTFIYVTHDQVEAMALADRIVVMKDGQIEQIGTPREVYDAPDTRFVAEFIGAPPMNFLPGTHVGHDIAWVGVRPEAFKIQNDAQIEKPADGLSLTGQVTMVEDLGADHWVHLAIEGLAEPVIARASADSSLETGGSATVTAPANRIHKFDADGRRSPI